MASDIGREVGGEACGAERGLWPQVGTLGAVAAGGDTHAEALDGLLQVNERHRRHRRPLREGALLLRVQHSCLRPDGPDTPSLLSRGAEDRSAPQSPPRPAEQREPGCYDDSAERRPLGSAQGHAPSPSQ